MNALWLQVSPAARKRRCEHGVVTVQAGMQLGDCLTEGSAVLCLSWYRPLFWEFGPPFLGFLFSVLVSGGGTFFQRHPIPTESFQWILKIFYLKYVEESFSVDLSPFHPLRFIVALFHWSQWCHTDTGTKLRIQTHFYGVSQACVTLMVLS